MKILITRILEENSALQKWCVSKKIDLIQSSFISTEIIHVENIPSTNWIFFTSPKCVNYFLKQHSITTQKVAAVGEGTAKALENREITCDFVGRSTDTREVGQNFKGVLGKETALFPIGNRSLKKIQNELNKDQVEEVTVYRTESITQEIPNDLTAIICSSPSNGEGLKISGLNYQIPMIAFGKSTEAFLRNELNQDNVISLSAFNEDAIVQALESLL